MKRIPLHYQILAGIAAGAAAGIALPEFAGAFKTAGELFVRALKMLVVPLIISSLVSGVTSNSAPGGAGRIGLKAALYYLVTSLLALSTGLFLVNIIRPGDGVSIPIPAETAGVQAAEIGNTLKSIIPENIFNAMSGSDMLGIIVFTLMFAFFITKLHDEKRKLLSSFFTAVFEVMMKMTIAVIRFAPVGVMGIVAGVVADQSGSPEGLAKLAAGLGLFALTVLAGLAVHFFVTLPAFLLIAAGVNPLRHYRAMSSVLLTAFSTSSSNATLPLTIEAVEKNSGVSNRIAGLTLPLGATVNMDGTGLYELVVAGFAAQLLGIELTIFQQLVMVVTALFASIGTAGIPMASYAAMAVVFTAVGLPIEAMLVVMPIDRPLDMLRTSVNVLSDTVGAVVIAKSEKEKLKY